MAIGPMNLFKNRFVNFFFSFFIFFSFLFFFLVSQFQIERICPTKQMALQVTQYIFFDDNSYSFRCQPTDYSTTPDALYQANLSYMYFMLKLIDFLDTIFFILRKKTSHVSFLHVYHHVMIAMSAYICVLYATGMCYTQSPFVKVKNFGFLLQNFSFVFHFCATGGQGILLGYLNSLVHAVMYTYYLLSIWMPQVKSSKLIKRNITRMQMVNALKNCCFLFGK